MTLRKSLVWLRNVALRSENVTVLGGRLISCAERWLGVADDRQLWTSQTEAWDHRQGWRPAIHGTHLSVSLRHTPDGRQLFAMVGSVPLEIIEQSEERTFATMYWKLKQSFGFQV